LADIQIHHGNPRALMQQGGNQMDGDGRLPRAALLITHDDNARLRQGLCLRIGCAAIGG
jgi:hypothetical protein